MTSQTKIAAKSVEHYFCNVYPNAIAADIRLIVKEETHLFYAVIYRSDVRSRPLPYKVFSFNKSTSVVEEINLNEHPQYCLRGYK